MSALARLHQRPLCGDRAVGPHEIVHLSLLSSVTSVTCNVIVPFPHGTKRTSTTPPCQNCRPRSRSSSRFSVIYGFLLDMATPLLLLPDCLLSDLQYWLLCVPRYPRGFLMSRNRRLSAWCPGLPQCARSLTRPHFESMST